MLLQAVINKKKFLSAFLLVFVYYLIYQVLCSSVESGTLLLAKKTI